MDLHRPPIRGLDAQSDTVLAYLVGQGKHMSVQTISRAWRLTEGEVNIALDRLLEDNYAKVAKWEAIEGHDRRNFEVTLPGVKFHEAGGYRGEAARLATAPTPPPPVPPPPSPPSQGHTTIVYGDVHGVVAPGHTGEVSNAPLTNRDQSSLSGQSAATTAANNASIQTTSKSSTNDIRNKIIGGLVVAAIVALVGWLIKM